MNSLVVVIMIFISKICFSNQQLSQTEPLTGAGNTEEWNGSLLRADTKLSLRHTMCSFGSTIADNTFRTSSAVTRYRAISRIHCVLICMQVSCTYFVFQRNQNSPHASASIVYPATNICDVVKIPLDQTLTDNVDTDVCTLNSEDVRCLVSPCYLMSGQAACSSESSDGPMCTCPGDWDQSFCYDGNFHTQK